MSWSLKKCVFCSSRWKKQRRLLVTSGCLLSKKYDELSKLVAFGQKLRCSTDQKGLKRGPQENEF